MEGLSLGMVGGSKVVLGEGGAVVMGPGGTPQVLGGIGVLLEVYIQNVFLIDRICSL